MVDVTVVMAAGKPPLYIAIAPRSTVSWHDWDRAGGTLATANYRAPGCAYCRMHAGNHGVSTAELNTAREQFERMRSLHLKNLYLGVGHQSPDYQWWHGHPAPDGDLLRIKNLNAGEQTGPAP